jgi:double-strand break repair protein MRE11
LVFWGHEHECRITPEQIDRDSIIITQPGSSVATSLCEGEAVAKHVGLLKIAGMEFKLKKLPIKSVRPFRMETIVLSEIEDLDRDDKVAIQINLEQKVRQMIKKVKLQWKEDNPTLKPSEFPLPLIRLKIDYSDGFSTVSPFRIGQTFINEIANPKDLIAFFRKRQPSKKKTEQMTDINDINELLPDDVEDMVESLIQHNLKDAELKILPVAELTDSIAKFVTKQETNAVSEFVNRTMEETFGNLELEDFGDDIDLANAISQARDFRSRQYAETQGEKQESQNPLRRKYDFKNTEEVKVKSLGIVPDFGFEDDVVLNTKRTMTSKGKAPAKRANPRKKTKIDEDEDEDEQSEIEEEEEEEEVVVEKPKRKRAAPKTALKTAPKPRKVAAKSTKTILKPAATKHTENTIPNPFTQATIISSEDEPIDDIAEIKDISQPPSALQYQSGSQRNVRKIQSTLNFGSSKELGCSVDTQAKPRRTKKNPFA